MNPEVGIVLLNWNQEADTSQCINSLKNIHYDNYKIFVVDNNSTDGSYEKLMVDFSEISFIRNSENMGFAGGMNSGISEVLKSEAQYILIMNTDTVVSPQMIGKLVECLKNDSNAGIAGPCVYSYYSPKELVFAGADVKLLFAKIKHRTKIKDAEISADSDYMTGCCMMFKRKLIEELNGFDPEYFILCEDLDLSIRAKNSGYNILCNPQAVIWHKESTKITSNLTFYFWFRNILYLLKKHTGLPVFVIAFFKLLFGNLLKNLIVGTLKGNFEIPKVIIWGIVDYIKSNMNKGRLDIILKIKK